MADDWENASDNEHIPVPVTLTTKKWDDEDVDDSKVKASWEDSDEEEEEKAAPVLPPVRKRVPLQQKIAEREEAKKAEKAAKLREQEDEDEDESDEDPVERKQRLFQLERDADLESAASMFKGVTVEDIRLQKMDPKTKEEFDEFAKLLVERIQKHEKSSLYVNFINSFVRDLCLPFKDVDVRKISSTLTTLANEKIKASKETTKSKKKSKAKPSLTASKGGDDLTTDYGGAYNDDDFDDFM